MGGGECALLSRSLILDILLGHQGTCHTDRTDEISAKFLYAIRFAPEHTFGMIIL